VFLFFVVGRFCPRRAANVGGERPTSSETLRKRLQDPSPSAPPVGGLPVLAKLSRGMVSPGGHVPSKNRHWVRRAEVGTWRDATETQWTVSFRVTFLPAQPMRENTHNDWRWRQAGLFWGTNRRKSPVSGEAGMWPANRHPGTRAHSADYEQRTPDKRLQHLWCSTNDEKLLGGGAQGRCAGHNFSGYFGVRPLWLGAAHPVHTSIGGGRVRKKSRMFALHGPTAGFGGFVPAGDASTKFMIDP